MSQDAETGEACQRCGSVGQDRRTLWLDCFYALEETGIPFDREVLLDADPADLEAAREPAGVDVGGKRINLRAGTVTCKGELTPRGLYTLRVCKRCRGEWIAALRGWFEAPPRGVDHDADGPRPDEGVGSGIFVRENGALREITREEWDARYGHDTGGEGG